MGEGKVKNCLVYTRSTSKQILLYKLSPTLTAWINASFNAHYSTYIFIYFLFLCWKDWKRKQIQCIFFSSAKYFVTMHGTPLGLWLFAMFFPCQSMYYIAISGYECQEHSHEIVWNVWKISCHQMKWVNQHRKYWRHGSTLYVDSAVSIQPGYMLIYIYKFGQDSATLSFTRSAVWACLLRDPYDIQHR